MKLAHFLCGVIEKNPSWLADGFIKLNARDGYIAVENTDKGLALIQPGKRLLVVVSDGVIWAVFRRPKIRLMIMIGNGTPITEEILEMYNPVYLKRFS